MTIDCNLQLGEGEDVLTPCEASCNSDGEDFKVVRCDTGEDVTERLSFVAIFHLQVRLSDAEQRAKQDGDE